MPEDRSHPKPVDTMTEADYGELKSCPRCAEEVKQAALICRYCNYQFPIGNQDGKVGNPEWRAAKYVVGVFVLLFIGLLIGGNNPDKTNLLGQRTVGGTQTVDAAPGGVVGSAEAVSSTKSPSGFREINWKSALPSVAKLRATAMKGCAIIKEDADFQKNLPCSYSHIETDDIMMFDQKENVPPFLGIAVSEQILDWSNNRFWSGQVFSKNESDYIGFQRVLTSEYGPPTFENPQLHITRWRWRTPAVQVGIQLYLDPQHTVSLLVTREDKDP